MTEMMGVVDGCLCLAGGHVVADIVLVADSVVGRQNHGDVLESEEDDEE